MSHKVQSSWYLAQTKPNAHALAVRNLARQGLTTFLPLHAVTGRNASRFVARLRPLFPGYLFVEIPNRSAPWRAINSTLGIARLVSFGPEPIPVPDGLVLALQKRCDSDGTLMETTEIKAGDPVQIMQGPFSEFVARVEQIAPDQRVWVLIDMMGRTTRIAVPRDGVLPL
jgi:transcriptional antiterminator RfaH